MTEYVKVNGVRVNWEKYQVKLRKLRRLEGRRAGLVGRGSSVVHAGTLRLVRPTGRQVYPRLVWEADCGRHLFGQKTTTITRATCGNCARVR